MNAMRQPILPPGLSGEGFSTALDRLTDAVGAESVLTGIGLDGYGDPYAFTAPNACRPSAAVLPASVEEVQAVLAVANDYRIPLWTVSRGRNFAYGGSSPRVRGSVIVDMSRMNRVLEVDDTTGFAIVEPGVSFADLHQHLRDIGSELWVDVPELSWGSVMGNTLERGFGYTPYGNHAAMACGMEVVLADGQVVRTGMGAMSGNGTWPLYQGGYGPSLDGLFLQSNFGIVTKMGVWLMPAPDQVIVCGVQARDEHGLEPLIDTLRPLRLDGTIQSNPMVGNVLAAASTVSDRRQWHTGPGPIPEEVIRTICERLGVGWWNAGFGLYGTEELTRARLAAVRQAFADVPGLELTSRSYPGSALPEAVHPADRGPMGVPSTDLVQMGGWRCGEPAHTDFSLVGPPVGAHAIRQARLIRHRVEEYGFDYAGGFNVFPRHTIALALISFDKSDLQEGEAVTRLVPELVRDAAQQGYVSYRSHIAFMDLIAEQFDFNDHALRRLTETIKDALDPHGVLSPGKQGIWPYRFRTVSR